MKILFLADEPDPYYYEFFDKSKFDELDLIVSCGDLKPDYVSFFATMSRVPVLYIRGNHDDIYAQNPPGGCECIEDRVFTYRGVRFLGLGGCMRYKEGANQFTDKEMSRRIRKMNRPLRKSGGLDILVTHAPARGVGDDTDPCHMGFECFNELIRKYHPAYHVHGHVHINYGRKFVREMQTDGTKVINAYQHYLLEIPDVEPQAEPSGLGRLAKVFRI